MRQTGKQSVMARKGNASLFAALETKETTSGGARRRT